MFYRVCACSVVSSRIAWLLGRLWLQNNRRDLAFTPQLLDRDFRCCGTRRDGGGRRRRSSRRGGVMVVARQAPGQECRARTGLAYTGQRCAWKGCVGGESWVVRRSHRQEVRCQIASLGAGRSKRQVNWVNERLVEVRNGSIVSESHVWRVSLWLFPTIGHKPPFPLKSALSLSRDRHERPSADRISRSRRRNFAHDWLGTTPAPSAGRLFYFPRCVFSFVTFCASGWNLCAVK